MTVTQQVIQELNKLPKNRQQQVLDYIVSLGVKKNKAAKTKHSTNSSHDPLDHSALGRLAKRVRHSAGAKLPKDFASQVDHYAYGVAKR